LESKAPGAEALRGPRLTSAPGPTISIGELLAGINREDGTPLLRLPGQMEQIASPANVVKIRSNLLDALKKSRLADESKTRIAGSKTVGGLYARGLIRRPTRARTPGPPLLKILCISPAASALSRKR